MKAAILLVALAPWLAALSARADVVERGGDLGSILLPAGAVAGTLVAKDTRGLGQFAAAYASAMAVVYVLKPSVDRTRPDGGRHSFPSGHTASAFAGAAFVQRRCGWRLGVPAYTLASFVGYSRVEAKRHYTSDVVAGAAIGIAANCAFTHSREHVSLGFDLGGSRAGPVVTIVW